MSNENRIILVTGMMAAGKSSVAQELAGRLHPGVHLRGDIYRRMIVSGRAEMTANPDAAALSQLLLRYRASHQTAKLYWEAGFNVVYQDVVIGPILRDVVEQFRGLPIHVVVLCPRKEVIAQRESARPKTGYGATSIEELFAVFRETPRIGDWMDNSDASVEHTVDAILERIDDARIHWT